MGEVEWRRVAGSLSGSREGKGLALLFWTPSLPSALPGNSIESPAKPPLSHPLPKALKVKKKVPLVPSHVNLFDLILFLLYQNLCLNFAIEKALGQGSCCLSVC